MISKSNRARSGVLRDMLTAGARGLLGGILSGERFQDMIGNPSPTMEGLLSAIYCFGCAAGAGVSFALGDKMGRVGTIIWANVVGMIKPAVLRKFMRCAHSSLQS